MWTVHSELLAVDKSGSCAQHPPGPRLPTRRPVTCFGGHTKRSERGATGVPARRHDLLSGSTRPPTATAAWRSSRRRQGDRAHRCAAYTGVETVQPSPVTRVLCGGSGHSDSRLHLAHCGAGDGVTSAGSDYPRDTGHDRGRINLMLPAPGEPAYPSVVAQSVSDREWISLSPSPGGARRTQLSQPSASTAALVAS